MVGFQDSIDLVKETLRDSDYATTPHLQNNVDHDKILRDYDEMMREHERRMEGHRRHVKRHRDDCERSRTRSRSPKPSMRFRFKTSDKTSSSASGSGKKRKHRTRDYGDRDRRDERGRENDRHRPHRPRTATRTPSPGNERPGKRDADISAYAAHPFARPKATEYLDPAESASTSPQPQQRPYEPANNVFKGPDDAFRASLFDAIADDEGAAYWEGVYGEPIHVYSRPTVETEKGVLEEMSDDKYAEYVKRKMWEKKNPELVREREERAKRELEEDEKRQRRRRGGKDGSESGESDYEWVGNEEKGYERRRIKSRFRARQEYSKPKGRGFMSEVDEALARGAKRKETKKWQEAWSTYRQKWAHLKENRKMLQGEDLAHAIPWPVLSGDWESVGREAVETFFRKYSLAEGETLTGLLKAERFRWHPDKIQHRFGGDNVDADTLKLVTSVFQTIDEMMTDEKKRTGA